MAKRNKPDTPPEPESAPPAAETTQEHAAAGEAPSNAAAIVALIVKAKRDGFRRAGRAWSREQTRVDVAELSEADIEALFAEPMLDVVGVGE